MTATSWFGKFGPLATLLAAQIVLILTVPSTPPTAAALNSPTETGLTTPGGTTAGTGTPTGGPVVGSTGTAAGGGAGVGGATGGGTAGNVPGASGAALQKLPGDTTHCVHGRQFDPALEFYAPPCVPGKPGAAYPNNGGATWQGVTASTIEVVDYVPDYGAEVNAIDKAQGTYYTAGIAKKWDTAYADFINSHYQLWGRKIHVDTVAGTCSTVPPDYSCLLSEMDSIVSKYHPYAFYWESPICSVCFAELARLKVVNVGSEAFSSQFYTDTAPYSYTAGETATQVLEQYANWWCNQMANRPAIFAGTRNATENFRSTKRQLGVIATNDPQAKYTVQHVLYPALAKCGQSVNGHEYFYSQDVNTATQQSQSAASKMNTPRNPATTVLCFCDNVAPQFFMNAFASDNYWPEWTIADVQTMDWDSSGQTYASSDHKSDQLSCPNGDPCPYANGIGLSTEIPQGPDRDSAALRIFQMETKSNSPPGGVARASLDLFWNTYSMLASLIQNAGPILTPQRMQEAAPKLGARGGDALHPLRSFSGNDWGWTKDVRLVYWDAKRTSPYNGQHGTYVQVGARRYDMNFPKVSQPSAPKPEDRQ